MIRVFNQLVRDGKVELDIGELVITNEKVEVILNKKMQDIFNIKVEDRYLNNDFLKQLES